MTATAPAHWHAIEQVREALEGGWHVVDEDGKRVPLPRHENALAALGLLQEAIEAAEHYLNGTDPDGWIHLRDALVRARAGVREPDVTLDFARHEVRYHKKPTQERGA